MTKKQQNDLVQKIDALYVMVDSFHKEADQRFDSIERVLILQESNLKIHMKRSDALEQLLEKTKEQDIKPIARHVAMVEGVAKFIGFISMGVSIAAGVFGIFSYLL